MRFITRFSLTAVIVLAISHAAFAQERGTNTPPRTVFRDSVNPHWFASNAKFWYRNDLAEQKRDFVVVDAAGGKRAPAFDHQKLAQALSKESGKSVKADALPFTTIRIADDGKWVQFKPEGGETVWRADLSTYALTKADGESMTNEAVGGGGRGARGNRGGGGGRGRADRSSRSPDGNWEAFVKNNNLYIRNTKSSEETQLTTEGVVKDSYSRSVERERGVGMQFTLQNPDPATAEVYWSPDSKHLIGIRTKAGTERLVYYVESSPKDQLQPKLHSYPYLKAGDDVPISKPHLFDVATKKEILLKDDLFANPWTIDQYQWRPDSSGLMFLFNQRGHQVLRVVGVDANTGDTRAVVDEVSKTFIDYSGKSYSEYLTNTDEIVWMSERDGWNHLYLYDVKTGKVKNQITKGEWVVTGVERVDAEKRQVWFRAAGIHKGQDPYYVHHARVNFDGTGLIILTEGNGTHTVAYSPAPERKYLIDTYSRADAPPITELRRSDDGKLVCKLEEADVTALKALNRPTPEPFTAKARDGVTDIYGVIVRPKDFDAKKKYPVLENVYAGPHGFFTPKAFNATERFSTLADKGFIVVQSDGLGTSGRSKKFHDVAWKNIIDAGFPDRILWMKAAAAKYPALDLTRVGIYGTSAGGQDALAGILTHPEFYKACVADCGCHDNRMDKIWWNEAWMGWPVGPEYEKSSNVPQVGNLQGKLLLMVGEADENVDPATTMQVVNALIKADKDFDLLVSPGSGHGVARTPYGERRLRDFFVHAFLENGSTAVTAPSQSH